MNMTARSTNLTSRSFTTDRGNVGIVMALAVMPLMLAVGGAIDYNNSVRARTTLQAASDAAALAAARAEGTTAQRQTVAQNYFTNNLGQYATGYGAAMTLSESEKTVRVSSTMNVPNYIMGLAGFESTTVGTVSEVT
jgi:Flp pilus assembly protein TadG